MGDQTRSSSFHDRRLPVQPCLLAMLIFVMVQSQPAFTRKVTTTPSPNSTTIMWPCGKCHCNNTYVDCYKRGLKAIPVQHFPTTAETINLAHNKIENLPDEVFSGFSSLRYLDLSSNRLTRLNVAAFHGLLNLYELNIAWNSLGLSDDSYPAGVFRPMNGTLYRLRLEGNCHAQKSSSEGEIVQNDRDNCKVKALGGNASYPDKALGELTQLTTLYMDGLPNSTFGPDFANLRSLQRLHLLGYTSGYCNLSTLTNETFINLPRSLYLMNLSDCNIVDIEPNAFGSLLELHTLDLSYNKELGFDVLAKAMYGFQGSKLRFLNIKAIVHRYSVPVTITPWHTQYFRNTSIEVITASFNNLEMFCEGALDNMPKTLKTVNLFGNRLRFGRYFMDLQKLTGLQKLYVDGVFWPAPIPDHYPPPSSAQLCQGPGAGGPDCEKQNSGVGLSQIKHASVFELWQPDTAVLDLDPEVIELDPRVTTAPNPGNSGFVFMLPPNLKVLKSRCNQLYYVLQNITIHPNNSLEELDLNCNLLAEWTGHIKGLRLTSLNLANNFAHNVSDTFFDTLTSLKTFNGSRNNLRRRIQSDANGTLFAKLVNLEVLDLSRNDIYFIPSDFFKGLVSLKRLILAHNEIGTFIVNFDNLLNLRMLDVTYNGIHFFNQDVMDDLDKIATVSHNESVYVAIYYNPIACTCQHVHFLSWIEHSHVHFNYSDNYYCLTKDGSNSKPMDSFFAMIGELERSCTDFTGILIGAVSCCFCLLVAICSALAYRFRWKLRYLYYASRLKYRRIPVEHDEEFEYDAFVSYSSEDSDFVHGELVDRLEERAGLRLNVHNRDWVPGRPIPSNIVAAVQSSRRTLVVLTKQLLDSDWCRYEMQMATMEASYTDRDVLVFLLYEDIPSQDLPREVFYNLKNSTYIQYPHTQLPDERLLDNFWQRVALAINS